MRVRLALLVFALLEASAAKKFTRCELASALVRGGVPKPQIPDWICLAQAESSLNSRATNRNKNGSTDFGIFQINNGYWCSPGRHNLCKVSCSALQSDNIGPSIKCARQIYRSSGFKAWYGWKNKCRGKNLSSYVKGCRY
ncbi:putative lysozyme [Ixodes scapularis]|uniref:lysozyme n=1 Tax=Ixodes scapularis TaxID=6945 RepID=B7P0W4_IXOSC|nr:lysozyme, putative [Ixodes scapularis]|eukprot:XP_002399439.1 lysozyme, putative [Ixodes scapularis]